MKGKLKKFLLSFLLISVIIVASSVTASAESVEVPDYDIDISTTVYENDGGSYYYEQTFSFSPRNNTPTSKIMQFTGLPSGPVEILTVHTITPRDSDIFFEKGKSTDFILENAFYCLQLKNGSTTYAWSYFPNDIRLLLEYSNGEYEYIEDYQYNVKSSTSCNYYFFEFTPKYDVVKVELLNSKQVNFPFENAILNYYAGQTHDTEWLISIDQEDENTSKIIQNQDENTQEIIQNQDENTDKILDAGSDVPQPDFDSTNGQIDDTVGQIESIEGSYQIDQGATQEALDSGNSFLQGTDMQKASIQVKTWIEKFTSDSPVMSGFFVAAMVLGLCFWVIGRKAGSG